MVIRTTSFILLGFAACLPAGAGDFSATVVGTTATQAVLSYTAPNEDACSVEVSESPTYAPLVHDVDARLFAGANLDNRAGNIFKGTTRIIVIGKRLADSTSLDRKTYSRALQAYTLHHYRIKCGASAAAGTFKTANIPLGMTYSDLPARPIPTAIEDRTQVIIDPHTGALMKRVSLSKDGPQAKGGGAFLAFGGDSRMCGNALIGPAPGFLCAFPNDGGGYALLYYIIPATGEARFLGQIPGLVYPSIDNTDSKMYFNAYDNAGKVIGVNRFAYKGDFRSAPSGSNAALTLEVFSKVSTSTLMAGFDRNFDPVKFPCGGIDVRGKYGLIECGRAAQDSYGWLGVLDMGNRQPIGNCGSDPALCPHMIAANQTYANGPTRWTGLHHVTLLPNNIPLVVITTHGLSGTNKDPAVGPFNSTLLADISPADTVLSVSGDPKSVIPDVTLQPWKVGDIVLLCKNGEVDTTHTTENENVKILAIDKSGPHMKLTVQRQWGGEYREGGIPYRPAIPHSAGTLLTAVGNNVGPGGGWASVYWDFLNDPHGANQIIDRLWPGGHEDFGPNLHLQEGYLAVKGPLVKMIGTAPNFKLDQSPAFAGARGLAFGNSYAAHPSYHQIMAPANDQNWFLDMLPFFGGNLFSSVPGVKLISGQLWQYLDVSPPLSASRKILPTLALSETTVLTDVSGPGSTINDTTKDSYKYCVALLNGECRTGSRAGDIFANVPGVTTTHCYSGTAKDVCIAPFATNGNAIVQLGLTPNRVGEIGNDLSWNGAGFSRVLSNGLAGFREMFEYATAKSLPDGSWAMFPTGRPFGSEAKNVWLLKLPPYAQMDKVDRSTFLAVPITLKGRPGATAQIEFGYTEQSGKCTSRNDPCEAVEPAVKIANPFWYASEKFNRATCSGGCTIAVPVLPMHVAYWQAKYFDATGAMTLGENGVTAETANITAGSPLKAP